MKNYSFFKTTLFLFILYLTMFSNSLVLGQEQQKFRINLQTGLALPYGQLASKQFKSGGYAVYGRNSSAEGILQFNSHMAVGVSFSALKFPFDDNTYARDLLKSDVFMDFVYMKSDTYDVLTYTAAIYYTRSVFKKLSLTGNLGGGIIWAQTPDQLFSATYFAGKQSTYKITPSRDTKPVMTIGLSCRYPLFGHVDVSLDAKYYYANMGFGFNRSTNSYTRWLTFSYLSAGFGINLLF
jgi:hypothetical protein